MSIIYEAMALKASKCISNAAASGAQCGQELADYRFVCGYPWNVIWWNASDRCEPQMMLVLVRWYQFSRRQQMETTWIRILQYTQNMHMDAETVFAQAGWEIANCEWEDDFRAQWHDWSLEDYLDGVMMLSSRPPWHNHCRKVFQQCRDPDWDAITVGTVVGKVRITEDMIVEATGGAAGNAMNFDDFFKVYLKLSS